MAGLFEGKVVVITGAAGGVAAGVIKKFAAEGAKLVLLDHSEDALKARTDDYADILGEYTTAFGDLGKPEDVDKMVAKAHDTFGTIDALVHIAGGFAMGDPVHEADISVYEKMMYLNARLTFITLGKFAKYMVAHKVKGSIVTILAKAGLSGAKNMAAYTASKAAAMRIMESMAQELKAHDIRVNGIMPSIVDTQANRNDMPNANFDNWVTPEQIADTIAFLVSDAASSIYGQSIGTYNKV